MNRKNFLKTGFLSAAVIGLGSKVMQLAGKTGETETEQGTIGYNHLPNKEIKTMNTVLHKAETRGHANHGWLDTHHTFSFANYMNPDRMHFGNLRVLNDDIVDGGMGFGTHPHNNMEIISIPLSGDLEHKDSMGNVAVIKQNDIQIMSAGTGIYHSEYNKNTDNKVNFLQIWVFPKQKNIEPRYDQITLVAADRDNKLQQIVSPGKDSAGVWINQDAWFYLGSLKKGFTTNHKLNLKGNGIYAFVINGNVTISGQALNRRDGFGVWDTDAIDITADSDAELLLMEVPMAI
ncbi:MAG: pirin family protein [Bacteroidetes bacterium]|nr:MAG: pirin family protein [Bacteroidota bacterium]